MRAGWLPWLERCWRRGWAHGSELVDLQCEAAAGRWYTGPSDADDALAEMERRGWIRREVAPSPTVSQAAFAGLTYSAKGYAAAAHFHASHWTWYPIRASTGLLDALIGC